MIQLYTRMKLIKHMVFTATGASICHKEHVFQVNCFRTTVRAYVVCNGLHANENLTETRSSIRLLLTEN